MRQGDPTQEIASSFHLRSVGAEMPMIRHQLDTKECGKDSEQALLAEYFSNRLANYPLGGKMTGAVHCTSIQGMLDRILLINCVWDGASAKLSHLHLAVKSPDPFLRSWTPFIFVTGAWRHRAEDCDHFRVRRLSLRSGALMGCAVDPSVAGIPPKVAWLPAIAAVASRLPICVSLLKQRFEPHRV